MKHFCSKPVELLRASVAIGSLLIASLVTAQDSLGSNNVYDMQVQIGSDGLAVQQPVISQQEILATLSDAHRLLSAKERAALKVIDDSDNGNDLVVAAVMPGGLIYLAIQKQKVDNAKQQLSSIEMELNGLDKDAITLYEPVGEPITLARFP